MLITQKKMCQIKITHGKWLKSIFIPYNHWSVQLSGFASKLPLNEGKITFILYGYIITLQILFKMSAHDCSAISFNFIIPKPLFCSQFIEEHFFRQSTYDFAMPK